MDFDPINPFGCPNPNSLPPIGDAVQRFQVQDDDTGSVRTISKKKKKVKKMKKKIVVQEEENPDDDFNF